MALLPAAGRRCRTAWPVLLRGDDLSPECARACAEALARLEYLTAPAKFGDVSRGNPVPHRLPNSGMKTFAGILTFPQKPKPGAVIPVTGYAQVGVSGLTKVQTWLAPKGAKWPADDPYFTKAPWRDAEILGPPKAWGGGLPGDQLPGRVHGFDAKTGRPQEWPLLLAMAHWAAALPGLKPGEYVLRARTLDAKGIAQPLPRPFPKSGRNAIEARELVVG